MGYSNLPPRWPRSPLRFTRLTWAERRESVSPNPRCPSLPFFLVLSVSRPSLSQHDIFWLRISCSTSSRRGFHRPSREIQTKLSEGRPIGSVPGLANGWHSLARAVLFSIEQHNHIFETMTTQLWSLEWGINIDTSTIGDLRVYDELSGRLGLKFIVSVSVNKIAVVSNNTKYTYRPRSPATNPPHVRFLRARPFVCGCMIWLNRTWLRRGREGRRAGRRGASTTRHGRSEGRKEGGL